MARWAIGAVAVMFVATSLAGIWLDLDPTALAAALSSCVAAVVALARKPGGAALALFAGSVGGALGHFVV